MDDTRLTLTIEGEEGCFQLYFLDLTYTKEGIKVEASSSSGCTQKRMMIEYDKNPIDLNYKIASILKGP